MSYCFAQVDLVCIYKAPIENGICKCKIDKKDCPSNKSAEEMNKIFSEE